MGSFDVACGLSGLTIHPGDPIAVMFLRKKPHREKLEMFKKFTVDREQNFEPSFPIIRGTYDDYGSITNITETPVTRAISTLSGLSTVGNNYYKTSKHYNNMIQ